MNIRTILPAVAATVLMTVAGAAAAQGSSSGAYAGAGATAEAPQDRYNRGDDRRDRNRDRDQDRRERVVPSTSSTYGAGQVETDENRTRATVVSGGQASGAGSTSASSTVDAYGETTQDGTSADIYGSSTANADEPRPERRRPR